MSVQRPRFTTEDSIALPDAVVEQIAEDVAREEHPTEDDVRDYAFEYIDRSTEFVTEDGEQLLDAVADRLDS